MGWPINSYCKSKDYYMMSIALTRDVVTKGRIRVSQGQWEYIANMSAAVDIKNNNQYSTVLFLSSMMN
jgi:hypothetical protein